MKINPPQLRGLDFSKEEIKKSLKEDGILRISVELSSRCNLKCPYCYANSNFETEGENEISFEKILDIIKQAKEVGVKTITLVGGEPLIYPKVKEVISFIKKNGLTPLIFTNGTSITKEFADFLYDNKASIILKCNSLDNPGIQDKMVGDIAGTFNKIQKALSILIEAGFNKEEPTRLSMESVICHSNLSQIPKIFRFARKNNIYPYLELVTPAGRGKEYSDSLPKYEAQKIFYKLLEIDEKEFGYTWLPIPPQVASTCKYFFTSVYVKPNGKVWPCPGTNMELGDLRKEKLGEILVKPQVKNVRNITENIKGRCRICPYQSDCYGCRGATFNLTGDVFKSDPNCWVLENEPPLSEIRIEVTQKCNLDCEYCYVKHLTKQKNYKELSFEEIVKVIEEVMNQGLETISLTGGEPFLKYDLVKEIIRFASNKGLKTGILTNATLTTKEKIKELKDLGLTWIRISLDGSTQEANALCRSEKGFENIINTIKWAKELGLCTIVRTTANNKNMTDLTKMIKLAQELKADRIDIQPLYPTSNKKIDKDFVLDVKNHKKTCAKLLNFRRRFPKSSLKIILYHNWFEFILPEYQDEPVFMSKCGRTFCSIDNSGFVKTCTPNTQEVGNIRDQSILEIWNNSGELKQLRKHERYGICKTCDKFDVCLNSCPAATYNLYKDIKHSPPLCPKVRESGNGYYQ